MNPRARLCLLFVPLALCAAARAAETRAQGRRDTPRLFAFEEADAYGYEDAAGNVVIRPQFPFAWEFSEGLARVQLCTGEGYRVGFVDRRGVAAVRPRFEDAQDFREGLAAVRVKGKWGFINRRGHVVISPRFDGDELHHYKFSGGLAAVKVGERRVRARPTRGASASTWPRRGARASGCRRPGGCLRSARSSCGPRRSWYSRAGGSCPKNYSQAASPSASRAGTKRPRTSARAGVCGK